MRLLVFARRHVAPRVTNVECGRRGTGVGDRLGNKGGVAVPSRHDTSPRSSRRTSRRSSTRSAAATPTSRPSRRRELGKKGADLLAVRPRDLVRRPQLPHRPAAAQGARARAGERLGGPARLRPAHGRAARAPRVRRLRRGAGRLLPDVQLPQGRAARRAHGPARVRRGERPHPAWCDRVLWRSAPSSAATSRRPRTARPTRSSRRTTRLYAPSSSSTACSAARPALRGASPRHPARASAPPSARRRHRRRRRRARPAPPGRRAPRAPRRRARRSPGPPGVHVSSRARASSGRARGRARASG